MHVGHALLHVIAPAILPLHVDCMLIALAILHLIAKELAIKLRIRI